MTSNTQPPSAARTAGARLRALASVFASTVAAAPVSIAFAIAILVASIIARVWGGTWAASAEKTLSEGAWWTPVSALLAAPAAASLVVSVLLALTALVFAERTLGRSRLLMAAFGGGVLSVLVGVFGAAGLARWSGLESVADAEILAPSIAMTVAVFAASSAAGALWRRRVRVVAGAAVVVLALYAGDAASWVRLVAAVIGLALGRAWYGPASGAGPWRSSVDERRTLIAGFVALAGIGPVAALVTDGGRGPLAVAAVQFADVDARLAERCARTAGPVCDHQAALLVTQGLGPGLLAAVPLVLFVVAAVGLRMGRRAGRFLATGTAVILVAGELIQVFSGALVIAGTGAGAVVEAVMWALASIGVPMAIVVLLWRSRRAFEVRATRRAAARATAIIAGTFVLLAAAYVVAELLLRRTWSSAPSVGQMLIETLRRFLPPALLYDFGQPPFPHHGPALLIWQWVGVVFWVIVVIVVLRLYAALRTDVASARTELVAALRAGDAGTLSWLGTWQGVQHWFGDDRSEAVSYRREGSVALVVSDPVCTAPRREAVVRAFIAFAAGRGWTPVFYSVHAETTDVLRGLGWSDMPVAEETVLRPQTWTMAGKAGEKVRHPVTKLVREGATSLWTTWADLDPRHAVRIREISEDWVADKALPEMGFTLGGVAEMQDPEVRLMLALDASGDVLGVTSWLPSWRDGVPYGWTLDVMRRAPHGPNGVMEFLIASAAERMKADGIEVLSLSGAPLTTGEPDGVATVVDRVLARVADALEPLYGFGSLFRFKAKFRPEHHTMSMSYADPLELGTIGLALMHAYLPSASRRDMLVLARGLVERTPSA